MMWLMADKLPITYTQAGDPILKLTLPIDLHVDLLTKAEEAGRSLQDEVILRLLKSLTDDEHDILSYEQLMQLIYGG
jgi:hypothetical protein